MAQQAERQAPVERGEQRTAAQGVAAAWKNSVAKRLRAKEGGREEEKNRSEIAARQAGRLRDETGRVGRTGPASQGPPRTLWTSAPVPSSIGLHFFTWAAVAGERCIENVLN
jgi:hypothetical protein